MKAIQEKVKKLLKIVKVSYRDNNVKNDWDNVVIWFEDEDNKDYFETIDLVWGRYKDLKETLSRTSIADNLNELLKKLINSEKECTEKLLKTFFENLKAIPIEEKVVFREIHSVRIYEPIKTNGFELYNINKHKGVLEELYPQFIKELEKGYIQQLQTKNIICYKVKTRDYDKAQEIALENFKIFENVLSFFISNPEFNNKIRISDSNILQPKVTIVISEKARMTTVETSQYGIPSVLSFQLFENDNFQHLINLVTKKNKSGMELRISTAIDWASNGLREENKSKALIYFVFAIESLLKKDEKGIIKPSIVSQLSDTVGFILGNTYESRVKYAKMFSDTYGKRSEVVHYGKDKITKTELNGAFFIFKSVIMKLIEDPELNKLKSIDNLLSWCKLKKFS